MKKIILFLFVLFILPIQAQTLKAGISEEYVPDGFYGSWGVISKIQSTTNPSLFNAESRDIWILSGYSNILNLENLDSGAKSQIIIKEKTSNNVLKFEREKIVSNNGIKKTVYRETVEFILNGNNFSGFDNFVVENWQNNQMIKKSTAKYKVVGTKISGNTPMEKK